MVGYPGVWPAFLPEFFGLFRHGYRPGAPVGHQAEREFQQSILENKHAGLLGELAYELNPLGAALCLCAARGHAQEPAIFRNLHDNNGHRVLARSGVVIGGVWSISRCDRRRAQVA